MTLTLVEEGKAGGEEEAKAEEGKRVAVKEGEGCRDTEAAAAEDTMSASMYCINPLRPGRITVLGAAETIIGVLVHMPTGALLILKPTHLGGGGEGGGGGGDGGGGGLHGHRSSGEKFSIGPALDDWAAERMGPGIWAGRAEHGHRTRGYLDAVRQLGRLVSLA